MKIFLLLFLTPFMLAACSDAEQTALKTTPLNQTHWEELAAASTAAVVQNNNLIFMR